MSEDGDSEMRSLGTKTLGFTVALFAVMHSGLPAHAGVVLNGVSHQGTNLNGGTVNLGALALRALRLPDGQVSTAARE
jgi:hypothetical protein